jgi:hypothetical protein
MKATEQLRGLLSAINSVQADVIALKADATASGLDTGFELDRALDYLSNVFEQAIDAHGKAVLTEHLESQTAHVA